MDGIGGGGASPHKIRAHSPSDAVMMQSAQSHSVYDEPSISRPQTLSHDSDSLQPHSQQQSSEDSQFSSSQSLHVSQSQSISSSSSLGPQQHHSQPPAYPSLPPISPSSAHLPAPTWTQAKSPTSAPSNPFYSTAYRSATPPLSSSAEQSPLVSPAKRFSSGEVKPLPFSPTSPRQTLTEEDRLKFTQLAAQLKTRLTYAALKVENGWEKHSLSQIQTILNEETKERSTPTSIRRRSHTIHDVSHLDSPFDPPPFPSSGHHHSQSQSQQSQHKLTYESFWATHSQRHPSSTSRQSSSQPLFHATFPRRKPERLSLTSLATPSSSTSPRSAHTARDQSAAEIMIALASPRTRSEFSSPERELTRDTADTDDEDPGRASPTPRRARKRVEVGRDVDGLGIRAG